MIGVRLNFHFHLKILSYRVDFLCPFPPAWRDCDQAFEHLVSVRGFVGVSAASLMVAKEFVKYWSSAEREEVKKTVEELGTKSFFIFSYVLSHVLNNVFDRIYVWYSDTSSTESRNTSVICSHT